MRITLIALLTRGRITKRQTVRFVILLRGATEQEEAIAVRENDEVRILYDGMKVAL